MQWICHDYFHGFARNERGNIDKAEAGAACAAPALWFRGPPPRCAYCTRSPIAGAVQLPWKMLSPL
jgi:hypothetical protein